MSVPWHYAAPVLKTVDDKYRMASGGRAALDRFQAYVRDQFDTVGVSVHDEHALYVAITTAGLLAHLADNARSNGGLTIDAAHCVRSIAEMFTASLIDYLPDEVRP